MLKLSVVTVILLISLVPIGQAKALDIYDRQTKQILEYYFDLIISDNLESARIIWEPSIIEHSERLGIEYERMPIKADCNSPLFLQYDSLKDLLFTAIGSHTKLEDGVVRWKFKTNLLPFNLPEYYYYIAGINNYFWLVTSYYHYAREWKTEDSRYFRLYIHPQAESLICPQVVEELDNFVTRTARKIGLSREQLDKLQNAKIDYYLCPDQIEAKKLSGRNQTGYYDKAVDAIVAIDPIQYQYVTELLINYRLQSLPIETASFLKQGLAVYLGGSDGRSDDVVLDFGHYIYRYDLISIDSMLLINFQNDLMGLADLAKPVAACFAEYLFDDLDPDDFFMLYRELSGNPDDFNSPALDSIKNIIASSLDLSWDQVEADFGVYLSSYTIDKGGLAPGKLDGRVLYTSDICEVSADGDQLSIRAVLSDTESGWIDILLHEEDFPDEFYPKLYVNHYGNQVPFSGFRYCLRLDKNEAGLYDYATNMLLAKLIDNTEAPSVYFDPDKKAVSVIISTRFIKPEWFENNDFKVNSK